MSHFTRLLTLSQRNLVIAAWLVLTCNAAFFHRLLELTPYDGWRAGVFLGATALMLIAYFASFLQLVTWGPLARLVQSLLLLASALTTYFMATYGVGIDAGQIQNMMETDAHEVFDLLSWQMLACVLFIAGVPMLMLWRVPAAPASWRATLRSKAIAIALGLASILALAGWHYADYASTFREHRELRYLMVPHNYLAGIKRYYSKMAAPPNMPLLRYGEDATWISAGTTKPTLFVFVLGETARAESFGLNGYARNTTPELAMRGVINFPQMSSCGTATAVSVPCLFSGMTRADYDPKLASHREGLLDILQRAGYATTWIDNNSGCKGACDRVHNVPVLAEKKTQWCRDGECQDDLLADTFDDYIARAHVNDRVVVLHQQGSHGPAYFRRYPDAFKRYTPTCDSNALQSCTQQEVINTYDNTIAYTDHILGRVIDTLKAQADRYNTVMVYVSDHGESTGEHGLYLHGAPYLFAPSQQTHVPMVMWISPAFAQQGSPVSCLREQAQQPQSHDTIFHSFLGLLDVKTSTYKAALDWSAACRKR
ncbi:lipid A ethanolaminephosphotransferase [Paraperlucidibaca baekdonensis]|uniref:Lipid A ethanolaminephosphotransferase n=1 Tax=Paraperlucidibaca baekdonensis TaxID=748120 RepID=A0A3E0H958_9GAMM|nr:phosphoethanolamine--lipid A transferase [Paraperlucidibaca baekdonensis]REH40247.1 lipid A ethanolaminephosphotransferase [Paraperlucidibaca baekdonensis]